MRKFTKTNKVIIIAIAAALLLVGVAAVIVTKNNQENGGSSHKRGEKYYLQSFGDGNFDYNCSKEIEVVFEGSFQGPGAIYRPTNQEEFRKYCRSNAAIEYRAVLDILRREDVSQTIGKYNTTEAWVRALGHKYIHDKDYLKRILPAYSNIKIDCIIVVHSPEGTRFFIENGEVHKNHDDHQYLEVSSDEFLASLNKASDTDVSNFWLGLH